MKIDPAGGIRSSQSRRIDRGGVRGGDFERHLGAPVSAGPTSRAAQAGVIDGILALQEVDDPAGRSARASARGQAILDRLEELRLALLGDRLPGAVARELGDLARSAREPGIDPSLSAVLDAIELRAEVELAKLSQE